MRPSPAIDAFAANPAAQAAARAAGDAVAAQWLARDDVQALDARLAAFADHAPASAAAFAAALTPWTQDRGWLDALMAAGLAALARQPLAAMPLRLLQGRIVQGLVLLARGRANVTLCWVDPVALATADDPLVMIDHGVSLVVVLRAAGLRVQHFALAPDGRRVSGGPVQALADEAILAIDNGRESYRLASARGEALILRFNLGAEPPTAPLLAFDRHSGALVRSVMSDDAASRMLPLVALPRLAGRSAGAAPVLADLTRHADRALRWQAARELAALDPAAAEPALRRMMADDPDAGVRDLAATVHSRVLAVLGEPAALLEDPSCPV